MSSTLSVHDAQREYHNCQLQVTCGTCGDICQGGVASVFASSYQEFVDECGDDGVNPNALLSALRHHRHELLQHEMTQAECEAVRIPKAQLGIFQGALNNKTSYVWIRHHRADKIDGRQAVPMGRLKNYMIGRSGDAAAERTDLRFDVMARGELASATCVSGRVPGDDYRFVGIQFSAMGFDDGFIWHTLVVGQAPGAAPWHCIIATDPSDPQHAFLFGDAFLACEHMGKGDGLFRTSYMCFLFHCTKRGRTGGERFSYVIANQRQFDPLFAELHDSFQDGIAAMKTSQMNKLINSLEFLDAHPAENVRAGDAATSKEISVEKKMKMVPLPEQWYDGIHDPHVRRDHQEFIKATGVERCRRASKNRVMGRSELRARMVALRGTRHGEWQRRQRLDRAAYVRAYRNDLLSAKDCLERIVGLDDVAIVAEGDGHVDGGVFSHLELAMCFSATD